MALRVFTVGHSNRSLEDLIALLSAHGVGHIADVRRRPASRRHPQFERRALAAGLGAAGIGYTWIEALGGLRDAVPRSPNAALGALAGYADHMRTAAFAEGIATLAALAETTATAVMCAEADPADCHRSLLADWLVSHGWEVLHVRTPDEAPRHAVSPRARLAGDTLVYDRGQRSLF